jgi:flagellar hook-length control protein FliK
VLSAQNGATATAEGALVGGQTLGAALSAQNGATATAEDALVGGQPGRAADLGNGQSLAVMASLPGPAAPAGAQQSQTAALDRQAMALPTVDALRRAGGSGPAAESGNPLFPAAAALRLSEAKGQIRFATEAASSMLSAAGASTSASYANLPAQWVLTGAGPGGLIGTDADEAGPDNLVDTGVLSGVDGEAVAAPDAGHKQHANRAASTATDPIDLSAEGGRGASAADADSENSLAKRLAEGLAQRMLAAASSNNWKMQIDLKPAHLGRISVEMSMQQGQLEAVFDAGQASARQLISEGLDRLRQDLQRAGMNVAHLGLNFGSGAGTGGKPTPRGREGQSDQGAAGAVQGVSTAASGSRSRAGSDGLDVMV